MKVIFVTREGLSLPGARIRAYNFARKLRQRNIKAEVLSYSDGLGAKDGASEGSMGLREKVKYNIAAYKKLCEEKDVIIIIQRINYHSFAPLLSHIIRKNRIVLDMDDWEIREDPRYILGVYPTSKAEYLTRRIASLAYFCIAASSYLRDYLSSFNKNVHYIPSCVDTDLFMPNGEHIRRAPVKFAWTGTLHRRHDIENVKFIIDCFVQVKMRIKDISLDIIGDGIYAKEILSYISNCASNGSIKFVGWIFPDKIPSYLEGIDIGLFPLTQNTKFNLSKSPVKLFEYMAMEKATVSSCVGEANKIIYDGKDGFLAKHREDFVKKMTVLAENTNLRQGMGRDARKKILGNYSLNIAGDRLFSALTNVTR